MGRERWASRTIFLFAAVGSAVGIGNVWRFPYLTYKYGGGAFLIPYLIALVLMGIPLLILEFAIGQKLQKGAIDAFHSVHHRLRGIGFLGVFTSFLVVTYYAVVLAWALVYLVKSFATKLPWAGNAESFFYNDVLQLSSGIGEIGGINWMIFGALLLIWVMVYFCVFKGVKSVGKVVMITMPLPIILLVVLFIRGITLPGAMEGIVFYLKPNLAALLDSEVWIAAASQIFFTLSVAFGIMIAYASFNKKSGDIGKNAYITAITNSIISLFAGFVVFSVVGFMATQTSAAVSDVVASGPGLAFVVFPEALSLMPWAGLFSVLFFITLLTLGIDSAFSIVEGSITVIADRATKTARSKIAFLVCLVAFLIGIIFTTHAGLYFLDVVDHFLMNFGAILVGIFECVAIGWIFGAEKLRTYINKVSDWKVGIWWNFTIKYFIPVVLIVLVVLQFITEVKENYGGYPDWAIAMGWIIVIVPLVISVVLAFKPGKTKVNI